jgi:hypothetical protein
VFRPERIPSPCYCRCLRQFSRGKRFRSTNDPYFKLLKAVGEQNSSIVDLTALANASLEVRGSINNIKEKRLAILIDSKPICERYFYYNPESKSFAIEDPALFYFLKHLDWEMLRRDCGFKTTDREYQFDFALSFAGENREVARTMVDQLEMCDCTVFYDDLFESNYLGKTWGKEFEEIFGEKSRFVVPLLDIYHREKIWPTFEREIFAPRVAEEAVIPIYLDETPFPGIPMDVVGIKFIAPTSAADLANEVTDQIVFKLLTRLENL